MKFNLENTLEKEDITLLYQQLNMCNHLLNQSEKIAKLGHWQWDMLKDEIVWSNNLRNIYDVDDRIGTLTFEDFLARIHPEDRSNVEGNIYEAVQSRIFKEFYHRIITSTGEIKILHARGEVILNEKDEPVEMIGTAQDVTEIKRVEEELLLQAAELQNKNAELEKFAYIASHDLQEPLRKLTVFCSLLEEEYRDQLGAHGNDYLKKIVACSMRMRDLISNILKLSSVSKSFQFTRVDLNEVMKNVLFDLEIAIQQTGANIDIGPLPVIEANETQLYQVLQNLISNALKFTRPGESPVIEIKAEIIRNTILNRGEVLNREKNDQISLYKEDCCKLTVKDRGTGFDDTLSEKIFSLFQSLHNRADYSGNGIGLAIVKKIVEKHRGTISVTSKPGEGSTFVITLPLKQKKTSSLVKAGE